MLLYCSSFIVFLVCRGHYSLLKVDVADIQVCIQLFLCNFDIKVFNILGKDNHNLFSGDYSTVWR